MSFLALIRLMEMMAAAILRKEHLEQMKMRSGKALVRCLALPSILAIGAVCAAEEPGWRARLAGPSEPGERVIISGHVLKEKNGPPEAGTVLMLYQTDAKGVYGQGEGRPLDISRLKGRLVVGPDGQYEIVTIKPGTYPGGGVPAHIHVNVVEAGSVPREVFEFFFAGDRFLTGKEKGYVLQLRRDPAGVWRATQDVTLKP